MCPTSLASHRHYTPGTIALDKSSPSQSVKAHDWERAGSRRGALLWLWKAQCDGEGVVRVTWQPCGTFLEWGRGGGAVASSLSFHTLLILLGPGVFSAKAQRCTNNRHKAKQVLTAHYKILLSKNRPRVYVEDIRRPQSQPCLYMKAPVIVSRPDS